LVSFNKSLIELFERDIMFKITRINKINISHHYLSLIRKKKEYLFKAKAKKIEQQPSNWRKMEKNKEKIFFRV
jgi:hypothetical protein